MVRSLGSRAPPTTRNWAPQPAEGDHLTGMWALATLVSVIVHGNVAGSCRGGVELSDVMQSRGCSAVIGILRRSYGRTRAKERSRPDATQPHDATTPSRGGGRRTHSSSHCAWRLLAGRFIASWFARHYGRPQHLRGSAIGVADRTDHQRGSRELHGAWRQDVHCGVGAEDREQGQRRRDPVRGHVLEALVRLGRRLGGVRHCHLCGGTRL